MKCPKCACFDDKVVDSRSSQERAVTAGEGMLGLGTDYDL